MLKVVVSWRADVQEFKICLTSSTGRHRGLAQDAFKKRLRSKFAYSELDPRHELFQDCL